MDLQAAQAMRGKTGWLSKATVVLCFALTVALLAGSLFSAKRPIDILRGTHAAAEAAK